VLVREGVGEGLTRIATANPASPDLDCIENLRHRQWPASEDEHREGGVTEVVAP